MMRGGAGEPRRKRRQSGTALPAALLTALAALTVLGSPALLAAVAPELRLTSTAFSHQGEIPAAYSCEVNGGAEVSPPLAWSGVPPGARSLALIVDDPDVPDPAAPQRTWVHWVLYDLPPAAASLPAGVAAARLPPGTRQGKNDWQRTGYGAPCPPIGRHRYFFKLYALDTVLPDLGTPDKALLEQRLRGHVLARAELIGTYRKSGR